MKRNSFLFGFLIVSMALLIFFEPYYGWKLKNFLSKTSKENSDAKSLVLENENLKAELAKLESVRSELKEQSSEYIPAIVFSRYPMNFKNELLVDAGRNKAVKEGSAVLFGGVLIGRVTMVFETTSLIQTVFDSRFGLAARTGRSASDALLRGGTLPRLTLIPMKSGVEEGDIVYSTSPSFSYGLPIGEIAHLATSSDGIFREASLNFAYNINEVRIVSIAKNVQ